MTDWRTTFPGNRAADHVRTWLDERIAQLQRGEVEDVRPQLPYRQWMIDCDTSGMPLRTMDHIAILMLDAWNSLTPPYDVEGALADLRRARELVTPSSSG